MTEEKAVEETTETEAKEKPKKKPGRKPKKKPEAVKEVDYADFMAKEKEHLEITIHNLKEIQKSDAKDPSIDHAIRALKNACHSLDLAMRG